MAVLCVTGVQDLILVVIGWASFCSCLKHVIQNSITVNIFEEDTFLGLVISTQMFLCVTLGFLEMMLAEVSNVADVLARNMVNR